jgi:hypothetical protein
MCPESRKTSIKKQNKTFWLSSYHLKERVSITFSEKNVRDFHGQHSGSGPKVESSPI